MNNLSNTCVQKGKLKGLLLTIKTMIKKGLKENFELCKLHIGCKTFKIFYISLVNSFAAFGIKRRLPGRMR